MKGQSREERIRQILERYEASADGCLLWTGGTSTTGYGRASIKGRYFPVHRLSLERVLGRPIKPGYSACHKCDVPLCIAPWHLWEGTHADNMRDASGKGRLGCGPRHGTRTRPESVQRGDRHWSRRMPEKTPRGSKHGNAKLTEGQVREILASRETCVALAARYKVCDAHISDIRRGVKWGHLQAAR